MDCIFNKLKAGCTCASFLGREPWPLCQQVPAFPPSQPCMCVCWGVSGSRWSKLILRPLFGRKSPHASCGAVYAVFLRLLPPSPSPDNEAVRQRRQQKQHQSTARAMRVSQGQYIRQRNVGIRWNSYGSDVRCPFIPAL